MVRSLPPSAPFIIYSYPNPPTQACKGLNKGFAKGFVKVPSEMHQPYDAFALFYCHMSQKFRGAEAFSLLFLYVIVAAARNVWSEDALLWQCDSGHPS